MQITMILRGKIPYTIFNVKSYIEEKEILKITLNNDNIISIKLNNIKEYKVYGEVKK